VCGGLGGEGGRGGGCVVGCGFETPVKGAIRGATYIGFGKLQFVLVNGVLSSFW